jgi:hypothetical protein
VTIERSSQLRSRSGVSSPPKRPRISVRRVVRSRTTKPSSRMSWSTRRPGPRLTTRSVPERSTAFRVESAPTLAPVNQTSRPSALQARPSSEDQSRERTVRCPAASTATTSPRSSPGTGWARKATRSPVGERRSELILAAERWISWPGGSSTRSSAPLRTTAMWVPSALTSAPEIPSTISRGAPPATGARASTASVSRRNSTASSPDLSIRRTSARSGRSRARGTVSPGRVT